MAIVSSKTPKWAVGITPRIHASLGGRQGRDEALDLVGPEVDIVGVARRLGVEAHHIDDLDELRERVAASLSDNRPRLFNVPITRETPGRLNYG